MTILKKLPVSSDMGRRTLLGPVLGVMAAVGLATILAAAVNLSAAKEATKQLTAKNKTAVTEIAAAVPENIRVELATIIQAVELARDRILLALERIENGFLPPEEGMARVRAVAENAAQKEEEGLRALLERVPAATAPRLKAVLQAAAESWREILSELQLPKKTEEQALPSRPGFDIMIGPRPPSSSPSSPDQ